MRLDRRFFCRPVTVIAPDLLGCILHTRLPDGETCGRIVETEAYAGLEDPASHAARLTRGRLIMAGQPGIAYVYRAYGIHAMFNVVCEPRGQFGAVLIRAVEPVSGIPVMAERRGLSAPRLLCAGPGRLCEAMGIRLEHDGEDLVESDVIWFTAGARPSAIRVSPRVGISRGAEAPLRYFEDGSPFVSAHRRGTLVPSGDSMDAVEPIPRIDPNMA